MSYSIAVLISGRGSNLGALIEAQQARNLGAEITLVISNRPDAAGLHLAEQAGIQTRVVDHREYDSRDNFDRQLALTIDEGKPDLVVLAGFMRILTEGFVNHFAGRMINIHPSLLPAFPGLNTHQRALDAGHSEHGASIHFVSADVDGGPVFLQARVPIHSGDNADALAARVLEQEHRIFPLAINWLARSKLHYADGTPRIDGNPIDAPIVLSAEDKVLPWADA